MQQNYWYNEKTILIMWFLKEFWDFLKERKKYWLFPILFVLLIFGILIILSQGSAIAPFIYTIPYQLFAYHTALIKGTDVDQPRNLAKSVTVE